MSQPTDLEWMGRVKSRGVESWRVVVKEEWSGKQVKGSLKVEWSGKQVKDSLGLEWSRKLVKHKQMRVLRCT